MKKFIIFLFLELNFMMIYGQSRYFLNTYHKSLWDNQTEIELPSSLSKYDFYYNSEEDTLYLYNIEIDGETEKLTLYIYKNNSFELSNSLYLSKMLSILYIDKNSIIYMINKNTFSIVDIKNGTEQNVSVPINDLVVYSFIGYAEQKFLFLTYTKQLYIYEYKSSLLNVITLNLSDVRLSCNNRKLIGIDDKSKVCIFDLSNYSLTQTKISVNHKNGWSHNNSGDYYFLDDEYLYIAKDSPYPIFFTLTPPAPRTWYKYDVKTLKKLGKTQTPDKYCVIIK